MAGSLTILIAACGPSIRTDTLGPAAERTINPVLEPGDVVRLNIWREPDLSGDYPVDEAGATVFPKVGSLPVGHLSADSVKAILISRYSVYLKSPSITVTFLRRVNVLGEVKTPGLYHVDPTMTVADVLALAGGVEPDGNPNGIELIRDGERLPVRLTRQSPIAGSALRSGDELLVSRRSWLSRNTGIIGAGLRPPP